MVGPLGFYTQKQAVAHPRVRFMGAAGTGKPERPPQAHPRAEHTEVTLCNMTHSHRMLLSVAPSRSLFCKLGSNACSATTEGLKPSGSLHV